MRLGLWPDAVRRVGLGLPGLAVFSVFGRLKPTLHVAQAPWPVEDVHKSLINWADRDGLGRLADRSGGARSAIPDFPVTALEARSRGRRPRPTSATALEARNGRPASGLPQEKSSAQRQRESM